MIRGRENHSLVAQLERDISELGPIPFSRFFKASNDAYYRQSLIGCSNPHTDFTTPSEESPLFNYATAKQIAEIQEKLGTPWENFTLSEVGAGNATFMYEALTYLQVKLDAKPRGLIIEQSPHLARIQRRKLEPFRDRVTVTLADASGTNFGFPRPPFEGALVFLEVLSDIFPPEIIRRRSGNLEQQYVEVGDGSSFEPVWQPFEGKLDANIEEGQSRAVRPSLADFGKYVKSTVKKGAVIIVDYDGKSYDKSAHVRSFGPEHLLPTASMQLDVSRVFRKDLVGKINPTADLDFDTIYASARRYGLNIEAKDKDVRLDGWLFSLGADLMKSHNELGGLKVRRVNSVKEDVFLRDKGWKVSVISVNTPPMNPMGLEWEMNPDPDYT